MGETIGSILGVIIAIAFFYGVCELGSFVGSIVNPTCGYNGCKHEPYEGHEYCIHHLKYEDRGVKFSRSYSSSSSKSKSSSSSSGSSSSSKSSSSSSSRSSSSKSSSSSSSKKKSSSQSYDDGYDDMYDDDDYDWDRYNSDSDYASGVDDAEGDLEEYDEW